MSDDRAYLQYIVERAERIIQYTTAGQAAFLADTKTQDAVLRNLQTLAESTQRLSSALKDSHPEIDWRDIAGFRNILVHAYLGISLNLVWQVVESDIPILRQKITTILQDMPQ